MWSWNCHGLGPNGSTGWEIQSWKTEMELDLLSRKPCYFFLVSISTRKNLVIKNTLSSFEKIQNVTKKQTNKQKNTNCDQYQSILLRITKTIYLVSVVCCLKLPCLSVSVSKLSTVLLYCWRCAVGSVYVTSRWSMNGVAWWTFLLSV